MSIISLIFGDANEKYIKSLAPIVEKINSFEEEYKKLNSEALKAKTSEFRALLFQGKTLDDILPEAFAACREAARRTIGQRAFDVQLLGSIVLHRGKIAEMKTGEGKTLAAVFPLYLNALAGKGSHLVTVNDYLSRRDVNWMGPIYDALGASVACLNHETSYKFVPKVGPDKNEVTVEMENLQPISRREAYQCDILYGTNNEFGFDYLRDNMVWSAEQKAQRPLYYAIVDEVDSILIDEARTPLIISAPDEESAKLYERFARIVPRLKENEDYNIDHKMRSAALTDAGIDKVEKELGMGNIYEEGKISFVHHLEEALRAQTLFKKDRDYVVKNGEVIIVDDFTGRLMVGRRYSGGLHQAIEAKEGVAVQKESKTMATITFQNYFRLYKKLAGMTGTAATSAEEFYKVYKLEVIVVPTNKKMVRADMPDRIYKTEKGKFKAVVEEIKARHKAGQPVLAGTISIGKSEILSAMLIREGLAHEVLNAKNHEREAAIIAKAGERGAITIATNMAGRGTDIKLGEGVVNSGGLHILGTERHEARRIDNQLRGRAGRQGDPGSSQFFVSLEDELMRILGAERIKSLMDTLGVEEDQPIEAKIISKIIGDAQAKIEGYNFDLRKHILEYDDVMNKHREIIYGARSRFLSGKEPLKEEVMKILASEAEKVVLFHTQGGRSAWDMKEIAETMSAILGSPAPMEEELKRFYESHSDEEEIRKKIIGYLSGLLAEKYEEREKGFGAETMRQIERAVVLNTIDLLWVEHLETVEHLRQGIGLRGYGQKDPLIEYKKEAYNLFQKLLAAINSQIANTIFKVAVQPAKNQPETAPQKNNPQQSLVYPHTYTHDIDKNHGLSNLSVGVYSGAASTAEPPAQNKSTEKKQAGRNAPCPCGATKPDGRPIKYKHCHGKNA